MPATSTVTVTVPATTANLGPGFDCIGAALSLHNHFQFSLIEPSATEKLKITVTGAEAAKVKTDDSNLAYQAFVKLYEYLRQSPPPVAIHIDMQVPLARGLGSSATAIVGGLVAANCLAGKPLSQVDVMQLAIELEGHPDNVVPALLGGCRLAASNTPPQPPLSKGGLREQLPLSEAGLRESPPLSKGGQGGGSWQICDIPWHPDLVPVVAIPDFELSTAEARRVLPTDYSRADAIFNAAHLGLLVRALATGDRNWLRCALQDKIHQPYRRSLIQGYEAVQEAAMNAGACGMVISGAGPTLLALTDVTNVDAVVREMAAAWMEFGVKADVRAISIDTQGAQVSS
ncbi:MAG: homoserine kinase [Microcoleus sp. PH2017_39_LGB_O_B]|uniref:homoserine kinase n=1 Tax=unclassified Microcoleus TaxID=2642155 RepID=UPI001D2F7780|nr:MULTISPECIES: homoserine kinase [unclassified Microcoleus]MCC3446560.1 homoserine kinase [Microcoleus sp. PH2017_09_SFU_O_A]MCC3627619.1 homoserine kinase [Microcoleus sp. PH2017_39_LGB_O_B]MCC3639804.1 homoserine kinase [Microcoleus sp. PH2017_33_LGB_O_A]TAF91158.1 MAG: homoserine kinase [Oscillatoriales cyanobacterium]